MEKSDGPNYRIGQAKGDQGVDLAALRAKLDKLHAIPQLEAGLNGKLRRVAPKQEPKEMTPEEAHKKAIEGLAKCVAEAEGDFIDGGIREIFRQDYISLSYNRRYEMMNKGNPKPMADMLKELEIEINIVPPPEGYILPDDCIYYRRIQLVKSGVVRFEHVWEWAKQE